MVTAMKRLLPLLSVLALHAAPLAAQEAVATEALATEASASTDREARALFDAGSVAFTEGRYESALRHFENAYALSPRPGMLFNIATAYDRMRRDAEALAHFRNYLEAVPDAPNRAEVEARIAVLEQALAQSAAQTVPAAPIEAPTQTPALDPMPVVLLTTGALVVIGGAATLAFGLMDASAVENAVDVSYADIRAQYERAPILQGVGGAAIGVGVALVLVGGISLSLASDTHLSVLPNGLQLDGRF
jgi:tetratricopeptide (TPR) repeat protein